LSFTSENDHWPEGRLGMHYLADLTGCPAENIATVEAIEQSFVDTLKKHGATVLGVRSHQFEPEGATVVVLLAESHASLHTWPESNAACVDIFTCGPTLDADGALLQLADILHAGRTHLRVIERRAGDE
jgi:S-adenosylmethionine decarboxylase proenzyme